VIREDAGPVNRLVLWDVDGTLVRCGDVGRRAIERAARRALDDRVDWTDDSVPQVRMGGGTDPGILLELLTHGGVDGPESDELLDRALRHLEDEVAAAARTIELEGIVLPGAAEVVARLNEEPGVVQSVLTGNIRPGAVVKLGAFGLDAQLDLEVGAYGSDHADRNRLVPLAVERASAKHGHRFEPDDVWVVGDTPKDLDCARAGGVRCLLVATGGHPIAELEELGADVVLPDLADVDRAVAVLAGTDSLDPCAS
jgi:phosphoglycolate phosphatase-like HAD superfamily hydrolase